MKFHLEETVTGAQITPSAVLLTFPRDRLPEILTLLEEGSVTVDAFVVDRERVTAAVFYPESDAHVSEALLRQGVTAEEGFFRLILRGNRLGEGRGLGALWATVLTQQGVPLRLSCADASGITQYLPLSARATVLSLLHRTFGIRAV